MAGSDSRERSAAADRQLADGRWLPAEFDAREVDMAHLLNSCFDLAGENLPPRYAQTLLGNPRHAPASEDFEERAIASVFERLGLERDTIAPVVRHKVRRAPYAPTRRQRRQRRGVRQMTLALFALCALLSLNVMTSGAALASMVHFIVGHGGAQMVKKYPALSARHPTTALKGGDPTIEFLPQWAGAAVDGYTFTGIDVYDSLWWTQGALVMLHYQKIDQQGAHDLTMLEFQPHAQVALQVVQDGSASYVMLGGSSGVFVSGQWVRRNQQTSWLPGLRAELICRSPIDAGVVVWVAADSTPAQIDASKDLLTSIAGSLHTMHLGGSDAAPVGLSYVSSDLSANLVQPFDGDVVALAPNNATSSPRLYIKVNLGGPDFSAVPGENSPGQQ